MNFDERDKVYFILELLIWILQMFPAVPVSSDGSVDGAALASVRNGRRCCRISSKWPRRMIHSLVLRGNLLFNLCDVHPQYRNLDHVGVIKHYNNLY